jgi:hypothetical protein
MQREREREREGEGGRGREGEIFNLRKKSQKNGHVSLTTTLGH